MRIFYILLFGAIFLPCLSSAGIKITRGISDGKVDGKKLLLDTYVPDQVVGKQLRPAVICIHGGGWEHGSKKDFGTIAKRMAERGYVAFSINYRLARANKNQWPAQLDDAQLAVRWVRHHAKKYAINLKQIAAIGGSAGGHIAAMLGNTDTRKSESNKLKGYSSRVNLVVSLAGPSDLTKDFRKAKYFGGRTVQDVVDQLLGVTFAQRGKLRQNAKVARAASPIYQVDAKTAPHLLIHGAKDKLVPVSQARRYYAALKKMGISCDYLELAQAGHGTKNPINLWRVFRKMERFLDKQFAKLAPAP